jgi:hypothetical protein
VCKCRDLNAELWLTKINDFTDSNTFFKQRRRKQKCSGNRPLCHFCAEKQQTCNYEVAVGMTRTEDLKHKVKEATERADKMAQLVCAMQHGTEEQSSTLLARLRVGASVDDLLHPETDPNRFPEYIRNGPRGAHSRSGSSRGITRPGILLDLEVWSLTGFML